MNDNKKLSWHEYFLEIANVVSKKGNCLSRQVGCIIVKDRRIISTGYNGTPRGLTNCLDGGCPRCSRKEDDTGKNLELCLCSHAEENAIVQAAYHGISVKDGIIYSTLRPCIICSKMIINAGIKEVYYKNEYNDNNLEFIQNIFNKVGIKFEKL